MNTAWVRAVAIAVELLCWSRLLLLEGPLATGKPKTLRYRLLHTGPASSNAPANRSCEYPKLAWATDLETAFHRVLAIP